MTNPPGYEAPQPASPEPTPTPTPPPPSDPFASPVPTYSAPPPPFSPPPPPQPPAPPLSAPPSPASVPTSAAPSTTGPAYPQPGYSTPAPAYGMPPTQPAPPSYDPTLLAQAAAPVSGPYSAIPMAAPGSNNSRTLAVILGAVLAIFVLVSGVLGALFVRENSNSTKQADEISALRADVAQLQRDLDGARRDLTDAEADLTDITDDRDKIAACVDAIFDWWATELNSPEEEAAADALDAACEEAGYL